MNENEDADDARELNRRLTRYFKSCRDMPAEMDLPHESLVDDTHIPAGHVAEKERAALRDEFAMAALPAIVQKALSVEKWTTEEPLDDRLINGIAIDAYWIADEMLKVRDE